MVSYRPVRVGFAEAITSQWRTSGVGLSRHHSSCRFTHECDDALRSTVIAIPIRYGTQHIAQRSNFPGFRRDTHN